MAIGMKVSCVTELLHLGRVCKCRVLTDLKSENFYEKRNLKVSLVLEVKKLVNRRLHFDYQFKMLLLCLVKHYFAYISQVERFRLTAKPNLHTSFTAANEWILIIGGRVTTASTSACDLYKVNYFA